MSAPITADVSPLTSNPLNTRQKTVQNPLTASVVQETFDNHNIDQNIKLENFINNLSQIKTGPVDDYISQAKLYLPKLAAEFRRHKESYLPWVRFLDVAHIHMMSKNEADGAAFKAGLEEMISQEFPSTHITAEKSKRGIDWRIAMKMLNLKSQFTLCGDLESLKQRILKALEVEINLALEHLIWKKETLFTDLTKRSLLSLLEFCKGKDGQEILLEAVANGRFDKSKFGLEHTLIMGEDGGLYLLLNRLSGSQKKALVSEEIVTEEYLKDKVIKEEKKEARDDKVVLGKGGFGTVKFALSLLNSRSLPSEIICIKKTKSFEQLGQDPLEQVVESTLGDYFTNNGALAICSPIVFDMAFVHNGSVNLSGSKIDHRKGYLMMDILSQNTATRIFAYKQYQKWEHQRPYLLDVLGNTQKLLESKIVITDLKPDNTLYDTNIRKATIIDLGRSVKVANVEELAEFDLTKSSFQSTKYRAPEMQSNEGIVDIHKSLAYSCGMLIKEVTQKSDYPKPQEISAIFQKLTASSPEKRTSIPEAIKQIEQLGDSSYRQNIRFIHYISKIKDRLQDRKSAIGINEDIDTTRELYIALDATADDPLKYKNLKTQDLFQKIDSFLAPQNTSKVMAIIGAAGSGKSITLQLKFIEAVHDWQLDKPLPVYFNLADGTDLDQVLTSLNTELGTELRLTDLRGQHLYIDSFDEGLGIEQKREGLIEDFYQKIGSPPYCPPKMLITCRIDYLYQDNNWQKWFIPADTAVAESGKRLEVCYVAPINYNGRVEQNMEKTSPEESEQSGFERKLLDMVKKYIPYHEEHDKQNNHQEQSHTAQEYLNELKKLQLIGIIDTGFMFFLVMEFLFPHKKNEGHINKPDINVDHYENNQTDKLFKNQKQIQKIHEVFSLIRQHRHINKLDIYANYIDHYQNDQISKLLTNQEQKRKIQEILSFRRQQRDQSDMLTETNEEDKPTETKDQDKAIQIKEEDINLCIQKLGNFIANQLHLKGQSRLDHSHKLFAALGFNEAQLLKHQTIYQVLRLLPLQIETKQSGNRLKLDQEVKIGFKHNTLKNYYLIQAIKSEIERDGKSLILASKSIVDDSELIKTIALGLENNPSLREALNKAIINSKTDKSESSVIYASNSITILVAAKYSFSGSDLRNIAIKGANLTHGTFYKTRLEYADLSNTKMRNVNLVEAVLDGADMRGANFEVLPHIEVSSLVNSVSFSPNGKWVVSGSQDKAIKLWNPTSGECFQTLQGHSSAILSVGFSSDGSLLISGSDDKTIKVWNSTFGRCLYTLQGHSDAVTSASFSPDGKLVVSSSRDKTIKVWNPTHNECLKTLEGHSDRVLSVSFSPDGKLLVSGSADRTIKLWDSTSGKCLHTLQGHIEAVRSVSFSPNGELLASGSEDKTIKLWDPTSGKCLRILQGHTGLVASVSFAPDGKLLASGSGDNTIKLWNPASGECLDTLQGHGLPVRSVSFSPDGKLLGSGSVDQTIRLWNSTTGESLHTLEGHRNVVESVSFSPDGKLLGSGSWDQKINLWDPTSGELIHTLSGHKDVVNGVCFSPDSELLVSGSKDKTIKVWNLTSGECKRTLLGHKDVVNSVCFSPDGNLLTSGSNDKTIKLWNPTSGECLHTFQGCTQAVTNVSFSPDGKLLASGSSDKTISLWNPTSGKYLHTLQGHTSWVDSFSFSPNDKLLASGSEDKTIKLWDPTSGECLRTLLGHTDAVKSVSFSPDGKLLVSGSDWRDGTVKLWDPTSGECLHTIHGHTDAVASVSFSPDGTLLVTSSCNNTINVFHKNDDNQTWLLKHTITGALSPLVLDSATLKNTKISTLNKRIFVQNQAHVESCDIDDTLPRSAETSTVTTRAAYQLSRDFLTPNLTSHQKSQDLKSPSLKTDNGKQTVEPNVPAAASDEYISGQPSLGYDSKSVKHETRQSPNIELNHEEIDLVASHSRCCEMF